MNTQLFILIAISTALAAYMALRRPSALKTVAHDVCRQAIPLAVTIPFTMVIATLLASLVPTDVLTTLIGADSGLQGILIACLVGAVLPGGPMVSFPLAFIIWERGAGTPQMVGLLAAWSIYALHRVISYELPMMGPKFLLVRALSCLLMPPLAAGLAMALLALTNGA